MERRPWTPIVAFVLFVAIMAAGTRSEGDNVAPEVQGAHIATLQGEAPVFLLPSVPSERKEVPKEESSVVLSENSESNNSVYLEPSPGGVFLRQKWTPVPEVETYAAAVADLESGVMYYERRSDARWPIASITKLMTAAAAHDLVSRDVLFTLTGEEVNTGVSGFVNEFRAQDIFRSEDLIRGMLLVSSNEIAELLARYVGRDAFLAHMNAKASEWGLRATFFKDPSGIAAANQSTIKDLVAFSRHLLSDYPEVFAITKQKHVTVIEQGSGRTVAFSNIHLFAGEHDFLGGKTGQTPEAGANLLSVFSYEGRPVVVIVLGAEDRFGESSKLYQWFINDFTSSRSN